MLFIRNLKKSILLLVISISVFTGCTSETVETASEDIQTTEIASQTPYPSEEQTSTPTPEITETPTPSVSTTPSPTKTIAKTTAKPVIITTPLKTNSPTSSPEPTITTIKPYFYVSTFEESLNYWTSIDSKYSSEKIAPVISKEWSASGKSSLKQQMTLTAGDFHYIGRRDIYDFSAYSNLSITIKTVCSSNTIAKVYIQAGEKEEWHDSGEVIIRNNVPSTISLRLDNKKGIDSVRNLGVQVYGPTTFTGEATVYVDNVIVD